MQAINIIRTDFILTIGLRENQDLWILESTLSYTNQTKPQNYQVLCLKSEVIPYTFAHAI